MADFDEYGSGNESGSEMNDSDSDDDNEIIPTLPSKLKPITAISTANVNTGDSDEEVDVEDDEEDGELVVDGQNSDDENALGIEGDDEPQYKNNIVIPQNPLALLDDDDDDEDEDPETYLQKFNSEVNKNYIVDFHPECLINNYEEISVLAKVIKDSAGNVIDELHKTIPFLTKYEKARVLGQRTKQINSGAKAFVKVPEKNIDGYLIAELELAQNRLPFIIRRPIAGGGCEYWNLRDLEDIAF